MARSTFLAKSDFVAKPLSAAAVTTMVTAINARQTNPTLGHGALLMDSYGGAINRVPKAATAFVHRDQLFAIQYTAQYPAGAPASQVAANTQWLNNLHGALGTAVSGQAYQNYIDPGLANWQTAYYGSNLPRLQQVKRKYDPGNVFHFAQSIRLVSGRADPPRLEAADPCAVRRHPCRPRSRARVAALARDARPAVSRSIRSRRCRPRREPGTPASRASTTTRRCARWRPWSARAHERREIATSGEKPYAFIRFARANFQLAGADGSLDLYWLEAYAGGLFLSFTDATSGSETVCGRPLPARHGEGRRPGRAQREVGPGLQLRVQPVVLVRPALGLSAGTAGKPALQPDPGRRAASLRPRSYLRAAWTVWLWAARPLTPIQ